MYVRVCARKPALIQCVCMCVCVCVCVCVRARARACELSINPYVPDQCLASDGFQHLPDSNWCVFLEYDTPTSYTGAKELCKAVDSELINLDSEEKFRALRTILISQNPGEA